MPETSDIEIRQLFEMENFDVSNDKTQP